MNKEEQIKTLTDDINTYLDFDGTCECVKEGGECYPNYQVTIETPALAKRLVNHGWNKIVWHKELLEYTGSYLVACGDESMPEYDVDFYENFWTGKRWVYNEDRVIAWTELPEYKK